MAFNLPKFSNLNPFKNFKITTKAAKAALDWFGSKVGEMFSNEVTDEEQIKIKKLASAVADGDADAKPSLAKDFSAPVGLQLGSLYLQSYDAKHKDTLPVWDSLPLFFLLKFVPDGYIGLNIHYMDMGTRVAILGTLTEYANNKKMDDTTRLRLSWSLINSVSQLEPLKVCIKHYLFSHVTSRPVYISPDNWETIAKLPIEKWHYNKKK